jgi:hypothetical protein
MPAIRSIKHRAALQTSHTLETYAATVKKIYLEGDNVRAADVLRDGEAYVLEEVPNASGVRLAVGYPCTINFLRGSLYNPQITGASGGSGGSLVAESSNIDALLQANSGQQQPDISLLNPILQSGNDLVPEGYVEVPGANIFFFDTPPYTASGGEIFNGQRLVSMLVLVMTSLPDPLTTTLFDGTLLDLVDSYGNVLGMYRLDTAAGTWRRRDVGPTVVRGKVLFGTVDGTNLTFTLANTPNGGVIDLYLMPDGRRYSTPTHYNAVSGATVTISSTQFTPQPANGVGGITPGSDAQWLEASYEHS